MYLKRTRYIDYSCKRIPITRGAEVPSSKAGMRAVRHIAKPSLAAALGAIRVRPRQLVTDVAVAGSLGFSADLACQILIERQPFDRQRATSVTVFNAVYVGGCAARHD